MTKHSVKSTIESKPKITIDLSPMLEAYCRIIFETPVNQKEIVINRKRREGQAIYSKVSPVEFPPARPFYCNPVTFILPVTKNNKSVLNFRFYRVSKMAEEQIRDDLTVLMQIWLFRFFKTGYQRHYSQEEIVNAILRGLNLRKNVANFDAIKKFDYRERRKTEDETFKYLLENCDSVI